jgi:molecular chaperone GrpE
MTDEEKQLENTQNQGDIKLENPELTESLPEQSVVDDALSTDNSTSATEQIQTFDSQSTDPFVQEISVSSDVNPEPETAVAALPQVVTDLKGELEDRKTQYLRLAADFENFRRRTQKEKEDLEVQIKWSTLKELLPVVDNFERARLQIKPQTEAEMTIHKSYQSVYKQLVECLKRVGVSPMRAEGKPFDPSLHEAVIREPTDQHEEGTVIEELVRGYLIGERVLRHALVKVAATPDDQTLGEESDVTAS